MGKSVVRGAVQPAVDWQAPWLDPWADFLVHVGLEIAPEFGSTNALPPEFLALNGLRNLNPSPQFVPHTAVPEGEGYEAFIQRTGQVPTRDNLHDVFNGLVWLRFPQAKATMNRLHVQEIARLGGNSPRGAVRDALTLFDENGALLQCPDALWQALVAKDWQRLFVTGRPLWQQARLVLFGHALLEKLITPRKPLVAHVYRIKSGFDRADCPTKNTENIANLDAIFAQHITPASMAMKPFAPLPVLGVPGWWPANEEPAFYDDAAVFRR